MKHKFIMMEMQPVCLALSGRGFCTILSPSKKDCFYTLLPLTRKVVITLLDNSQQPTLPQCNLFIHALNVFTMYRTAISRPVNKCIYKYIRNRIYRINKKEGNRNYLNGDLTKDDSTWSSTYIKTLR